MNILKKLLTAIRGSARELGEAVVDANSLRIYEQEIDDARQHLDEARHALTEVMARDMQAKRELNQLDEQITEHEGYARQALEQDNEALALEVAEKVASLEAERAEKQTVQASYKAQSDKIKQQIRTAEKTIADHERQLLMVQTTESVQKATLAVSENIAANNSQLNSARESLDRIRAKQQLLDDKLAAGEQLASEATDASLESKLKEAGIGQTASSSTSVLERIKSDMNQGAKS